MIWHHDIFHQHHFLLFILLLSNQQLNLYSNDENKFFLILTWFNTHYESMQDFIYCSEHCISTTLFLHQKSLLSALYTITVFNARTLWICFFFIFSLFHLMSQLEIDSVCSLRVSFKWLSSLRSWFLRVFSSSWCFLLIALLFILLFIWNMLIECAWSTFDLCHTHTLL